MKRFSKNDVEFDRLKKEILEQYGEEWNPDDYIVIIMPKSYFVKDKRKVIFVK